MAKPLQSEGPRAPRPASERAVVFQPSGRVTAAGNGSTLLDLAHSVRVSIPQTCSGDGTCGKCAVKICGPASPVTADERRLLTPKQLAEGVRLACQVVPQGDLEAVVSEPGPLDILCDGVHLRSILHPSVQKEYVEIQPPTLNDPRDDLSRLLEWVDRGDHAPSAWHWLHDLPGVLREKNWRATCVLAGRDIVGVEPGDTRGSLYGAAFDIGTTTVVGYLRDLRSGDLLGTAAEMNPQVAYGADVIARIEHTQSDPRGLHDLKRAIVSCVNRLIGQLVDEADLSVRDIYDVTVAGNTTMLHLLMGLPVENIARSPFVPVVRRGLSLDAAGLGLKINRAGRVFLLPHIASYVGADIVADLSATRFTSRKDLTLLLDFGTNAEIVLGSQYRILACSAAAGPCFEGGNISCGSRATRGALSGAWMDGDRLVLKTIGSAPVAGICGTGLLDLAALLRRHGLINEAGKLLSPEKVPDAPAVLLERVETGERGQQFRLASAAESAEGKAVVLTQRDIRELQAAKAAIAAGVRILCRRWGVSPSEISEVLMAGAFGNHLRTESGIDLGLLPVGTKTRHTSIGNAAGVGAQMALLYAPGRRRLDRLISQVEYVELSGIPEFADIYAEEMIFPSLSSGSARR